MEIVPAKSTILKENSKRVSFEESGSAARNVSHLVEYLQNGYISVEERKEALSALLKCSQTANEKTCESIASIAARDLDSTDEGCTQLATEIILCLASRMDFFYDLALEKVCQVPLSEHDAAAAGNVVRVVPNVIKACRDKKGAVSRKSLSCAITFLAKCMMREDTKEAAICSASRIRAIVGTSTFDHFLETRFPRVKRDLDTFNNNIGGSCLKDERITSSSVSSETNAEEASNVSRENASNRVILKIFDDHGNEMKRSASRRVTFGGEIVKMRTPDSDGSSYRKKVEDFLSGTCTDSNESDLGVISDAQSAGHKPSSIPLPVRPALHPPKHPKTDVLFKSPPRISLEDKSQIFAPPPSPPSRLSPYSYGVKCTEMWEEESFAGSAGSSSRFSDEAASAKTYLNNRNVMVNNVMTDLAKFNITDVKLLETIFPQGNNRQYAQGLETLHTILCKKYDHNELDTNVDRNKNVYTGVAVLSHLMNGLYGDPEVENDERVVSATLKVLNTLSNIMQPAILKLYIKHLVPTYCKFLGPGRDIKTRIEAADCLKGLMKIFSPDAIISLLMNQQCLYSKSSKMRENSLLCLIYALATFPSTEFQITPLLKLLIKSAINEPKRRVRQASLEAISILGQLLPARDFIANPDDMYAHVHDDFFTSRCHIFNEAVRARLTRRQLPKVTQQGLVFYAFQASTMTGYDIDWIMAGTGSLSCNSSKFRNKEQYSTNDYQFDFQMKHTMQYSHGSASNIYKKSISRFNNYANAGSDGQLYDAIGCDNAYKHEFTNNGVSKKQQPSYMSNFCFYGKGTSQENMSEPARAQTFKRSKLPIK